MRGIEQKATKGTKKEVDCFFDLAAVREGMIAHVRCLTGKWALRLIRHVLGSWGSHDAPIVRDQYRQLCTGDHQFPWARVHPIFDLEAAVQAGTHAVRFYWPAGATQEQGCAAADWWMLHGLYLRLPGGIKVRRPYDAGAYPKLLVKALLKDQSDTVAGWEWAHWCTEGGMLAWRDGAHLDPYHKLDPTPLTTEHRAESGELVDLTTQVVKPGAPPSILERIYAARWAE